MELIIGRLLWLEPTNSKGENSCKRFLRIVSLNSLRSSHLTERFCTAFLIRHLRKFLVLCAGPDNPDAHRAAIHLAAVPSGGSLQNSADLESLRRQHDQEHSNVGLGIKLRPDDLDRLRLVIQAVDGGLDDSLNICEILWNTLYESALHPTASMLLADVEQELQRHLVRETTLDLRRLQLSEDQPNFDQKELVYGRLKSTTVIVPPLSSPVGHPPSSAASYASEPPFVASSPSRLHDLVISDCTDTHMYILRPTEHVTIVNCVNCTIVVGAVAGLMHVTDCMHCRITTAARRVIVTGSSPDVRVFTFSPHAPLILGGSTAESDQPRSGCQFAPYNTYYEGLREDLVATGLAAAAVSENQQPPVNESNAAWPPLHSASNKWKDAHDLCQLEVPTAAAASSGGSNVPQAGADDTFKAATTVDIHHSLLVPATEFDIILVPIDNGNTIAEEGATGQGEIYSRLLIDLLHYSPFRLPAEYEKRVLSRVERMQKIQQAVQSLTVEQQVQFEEEFNADFRDWLVKTGNLRQILDLVHWEREQKEAQVVSTKH